MNTPIIKLRAVSAAAFFAVSLLALVAVDRTANAADTAATVLGGSTNLSAAGTYSPSGVPGTTVDVFFSGTAAYTSGTLTIANAGNLSIGALDDASGTALTIQPASGSATLTLNNNAANSGLGGASPSDLIFLSGSSNLTLGNGSGALTIATVNSGNFDNAGTLTIGAGLSIGATKTLTFTGAGATTISGNIAATSGVLAVNDVGGSVTLTGGDTATGGVSVLGGTFNVDSVDAATGGITIGGGTLNIGGGGATGSVASQVLTLNGGALSYTVSASGTQSFTSTNLNAGGTTVTASAGDTIKLGAITRAAGGTINFGSTGAVTTTNANANGILGGWATIGSGTGTVFAVSGSSATVALTGLPSYNQALPAGGDVTTTNNDSLGVSQTETASSTINSLTINDTTSGHTLALGANNITFTTGGGLLYSGNQAYTISGSGAVGAGTTGEAIINVSGTGNLTVSALIGTTAATAASLTMGGPGTLTLTGNNVFTGPMSIGPGKLIIGAGGATTLAAGAYAGNIADSGSLIYNSSSAQTLSGAITGAGSVTEQGSGTLTLNSSTSTFTGGINILAGGITIQGTSPIGTGPINLGASSGAANATFTYGTGNNNGVFSNPVNVIAGSTGTLLITLSTGSPNFTGLLTLANNLSLQNTNSNGTAVLTFNGGVAGTGNISANDTNTGPTTFSGGALSFTGTLSNVSTGGGAVTVSANMTGAESLLQNTSASSMNISGSNTNTGTSTAKLGTLEFTTENSLYNDNRSAQWTASNIIVGTGATLALEVGNAGGFTTADIGTLAALGTSTGGFENASAIGIDTTGASFTLSNSVSNTNGGANVLALTKLGSNTLTLTGSNTYTGATTISAGTLSVGSGGTAGTLGTGPVLDNATLTFNRTDNYGGAISQSIAGSGALTLTTGNLTLSGVNSFTGATTITSGTLDLQNSLALQNSGVNIPASATALAFDSSVASNAFTFGSLANNNNLTLQNTAGAGITLTLGSLTNAGTTYTGNFLASSSGNGGALSIFGLSNTVTLEGANTYTGPTSVLGGTLNLGGATANGSINSLSSLVLGGGGGGTLAYTHTGTVSQTFNGTTVNWGENSITESTATQTLNLGALTVNPGGTVDLNGSGTFTTASSNVNGILGGGVTFGGKANWATITSGSTIGAYSGYTNYSTAANTFAPGSTANVDFQVSNTPTVSTQTINSLRFNQASATTLTMGAGQVLSIASGGILVTPTASGGATITGGAITGSPGGQLAISDGGGTASIASLVEDNSSSTALVFSAPSGSKISLTNGNNSYSGGTYFNGGQVGYATGTPFGTGNVTLGDQFSSTATAGGLQVANNLTTGLLVMALGNNGNNGDIGTNSGNPPTLFWTLAGTGTATFNGSIGTEANGREFGLVLDAGTQIFGSLSNVGSFNGVSLFSVNGGTMQLGSGYSGTVTNNTNVLALGGGTFVEMGNVAGTYSQTFSGGLTVTAGASTLTVNSNGGAGTFFTPGAITRNVGGTVNINLPTAQGGTQDSTNGITTTTPNTNGILGGYATVGGTDWATNATNVSGGNIIGLSASTINGYTNDTWAAGNNTTVTGSSAIASATTNSLRFNAASPSTLTLTGSNVITSGGILVTPNVGANASTITSGTLVGAASADLVVIQSNTNAGLTIGSVIANNTGATALTKSGAGLLTLTGANTFTGALYLTGGVVSTGSSGIATAGSITLNGGALQLTTAYTTADAVTMGINGGTVDTQGNNVTLSGAVTNIGGNNTGGNQFVGSGALGGFVNTGVGALTKAGSGQLTLNSASNAFGGGIIITNGTVQDGNAASTALGTGYLTFVNNGNTPALDMDGHSATVAGLIGAGSNGVVTNSVSSGTSTLTLDGVYGETFGGAIQNGSGTVALTENLNNATETVTLLGNNTYSGATTVTSGNLQIGNGSSGALTSSPITVAANMTLSFDEANNSTSAGTISNSGAIVGNEGSGITNTLGGNITGAGSLTQTGSGTTILTGSNTYTGATVVSAGTLQVGNGVGGSISGTSSVASGATLAFNQGATNATYAGNIANAGTVAGVESTIALTTTLSGVISGTGSFAQSGVGTTLLSNAETYTGPTTISAGTLALSGSLGNTAVTIQNGGTFLAKNSVAIGTSAATLTVSGGGTFSLANNAVSTVTLNTSSGTALTIGGASSAANLVFDLSDTNVASQLLVAGNGTASVLAGGGAIFVNALADGTAALTSSTFTLISAANGGLTGNFSIAGSPYISFGTNSYYLTLSDSNTSLSLVASLVTAAQTAYWTGGTNLSWSQLGNFTSDAGGTTPLTNSSPITGVTDVFLTATNNVTQATPETIDTPTTVNSLTFTGSGTAGGSGVVLNTGTAGSLLKIKAGTANTYAAGVGLVVQAGGAGNVINANVQLGNPQTWQILSSASNALTVNGVISDNSLGYALTVSGPGELTLAGANTFSGGLILSSGTLAINNGAALGAGAFTISGGAIDNTTGAPLTITNNNLENWNGNFTFVGSNALNLGSGAITMSGSTQVTVGGASTLTVNGIIGGSGAGLALAGNGTLVLGAANTYSGNTAISSGATLSLANSLALQNSTLDFSNGALNFSNLSTATFGGLIGTNPSQTLALTNTGGSAVALTVGGNGSSGTYSGALSGLGSVTKTGAGTLALAGNNSYAGLTTVNGGELDLSGSNSGAGGVTLTSGSLGVNSSNALGSGTLAINGGVIRNTSGSAVTNAGSNPVTIGANFGYSTSAGTANNNLNLGNGPVTLGASGRVITLNGSGALAFGGALSNSATGANTLTVNNGASDSGNFGSVSFGGWALNSGTANVTGTVNGSGNVNFTGAVTNGASSASGLTYAGTGMLTLSASDTYTGNTTLTSGTLNLNAAGAINAGTLTSSGGTVVESVANAITGPAAVTLSSGAMTLGQANNYTGATTINGGTLTFAGSGALPAATAISLGSATLSVANDGSGSNGTISLGNNITVTGAITTDTINVGNNGSANTGNTIAFGALANGTAAQNNAITINFTGSNGYQESFTSLALDGLGGQTTTLNPTTTSVTIGNVTNPETTTGATHFDTLQLTGTSTGNFITGSISDSPIYAAVNQGDTRVTMAGTGAWTLAGLEGYHGPTAISSGTLNLTGTLSNTQSVATSSTGVFGESSAGSIGGAATFAQGSTGISSLAGVNNYTGATTVSAGTLNLTGTLSNTASVTTSGAGIFVESSAGSITGTSATSFTQGSTGISSLAGVNNYTGVTKVTAGTLEFVNETSLYNDVTSNWNTTNIVVQSGGTLAVAVNGAGEFTTTDINTLLGLATASGGFESGASIGIDTTAGSYLWSSQITNLNSGANVLGLEKLGSNTLTLSGSNTYSGSTNVLGGTLDLANQYAAEYSVINLNGGSLTFDSAVSGTGFAIGGLGGSGNLALQTTGSTAITLTIGNGSGVNGSSTATNGTYTGVLSGGGSLIKIGDNTQILGGANTYTGPTTINAGTLQLNFAQSGAPSTNILYNGVTPGALTMGGVASSTQMLNNPNTTLNVASASSGNQSQAFASLTLNPGYETISTTDNGTGNVLVNLNAITNNPGAILSVNAAGTPSATNAITTTNSNDATGILGGWAVVGSGTGYATVNGSGQIVPYAGYNNLGAGTTITDVGTSSSNANVEIQPGSGATVTLSGSTNGATNINTLFYNATNSATVSLTSGTLRLGVNGGILENAAGKTMTISGGTLTAGGSTANTSGTISIIETSANNQIVSIGSVIADNGSGPVTLNLAGGTYGQAANSFVFSGSNTYSGGTYLDGGRLDSTNPASFGTGQVTVMPGAQAILQVSGTYANAFNLAGIGQGETGGFTSSLRFLLNGAVVGGQVTLLGDSTIQVQTGTGTLAGGITGNYNLNLYGSSNQTLVLSGATTLGGNLSINGFVPGVSMGSQNNFVVQVANAAALPSGSGASNVIINGGSGALQVLDIHGVSASVNGLLGIGSFANEAEITNLAASGNNATLTLGNNNATATFGGNIIQTTGDGTLGIVKTGSGTQVLAGSGDTFTGGLTINQGTIQDANSNSGVLGTGNVTFGTSNTPTLDLDGNSPTIGLLAGAGANGIITDSAASTTSTLTLVGAGSQTFGGSIQNGNGTIALTIMSGTDVFTGANTYTGATTLNAGSSLNIGGGGATGSVSSSSALVLDGGALVFNETGTPTQTFSSTTLGNSLTAGLVGASNVTAASGDTLLLGAINRPVGSGGANFGGAGVIETTTANGAGNILGGWATFSGSTWAVSAGTGSSEGQITGMASSAYTLTSTAGSVAANYSSANVDVNSITRLSGPVTINTLRFNTGAAETLTLTGTDVISSGGILVTTNVGNNVSTITGGTIEGAGGELVINQNNLSGGLTIASAIADNGTPTALTLIGGGSVALNGASTYTGATTINGGAVTLNGSLGSTPVTITSGTFAVNGSTGSGGTVTLNAGSLLSGVGTIGGNVTLNNAETVNLSDGAVIGGTLTVAGTSGVSTWNGLGSVNGATTISSTGSLTIASGGILTAPGGVTLSNGGTLTLNGQLAGSLTVNGNGVGVVQTDSITGSASVVTVNGATIALRGNDTFGGGLFLNGGTISLDTQSGSGASGNAFGSGNITFSTSGSPQIAFRVGNGTTFNTGLLVGLGTNGAIVENFTSGSEAILALSGVGSATYNGQINQGSNTNTRDIGLVLESGTQILGGTALSGLANITVNNGTFQLGNGTSTSPTLDTTAPNALAVAGGTFILESPATATQYTASVGNLSVNTGASSIQDNNLGTGGDLLTLGTITRANGGTVDFVLPTGAVSSTNGITTQTLNTNGILGGYATVSGTDWAMNSTNTSGGNIIGLSASSGYTAYSSGGSTFSPVAGTNVDFQVSNSTPATTGTLNSLRFNAATSGTLTMAAANSLTVTSGGILVTPNVGANATAITSGTLRGAASADLVVIQNNTSAGFTIGSVIANNTAATGLTKSGAGLLTLAPSSNNTFTGAITINGGILNTGTAGIGSAGSFVFNGGTLQANGAITTSDAITLNYAGGGGTFDTNGASSTFSGVISGNGGLTVMGSGTATLSAASGNTFAGGLTINNNATVNDGVNHTGQIGAGVLTFGANGTLNLSSGASPTVAGLSGTNAGALITNLTNNTSTITLNGASNYSYAGAINNGDGGLGIIALTLNLNNPTQVQVLSGSNTYTGATTITQGSLNLSNAAAVQNSTVTLNGGGLIFDQSVSGNAFTFGGLAGSVQLALQNNASTPAAIALTVGGNNASTTYSGFLTGAGSLTKVGNGALTLSGNAFYTGATLVSSGSISLSGSMNGTSSVATSGAGAFNETSTGFLTGNGVAFTQGGTGSSSLAGLNTYTGATSVSAGSLALSGTLNGTSSVSTSGNGAFTESSTGFLTGNGVAFTQASSGASSLGGLNTYTGATSVSAGSLALGGTLNGTSSVATSGAGAFTESSAGMIVGNGLNFTQGSTAKSTLAGQNTYTGSTFINAGILNAGSADVAGVSGALGNGGAITFGGGTLQFGVASDYSSRIVNSASAVSVDTNGVAVTFANALASSNTGGLVVQDPTTGVGSLTLTASNAYVGSTTVQDGGDLIDGAASGALPVASTLIIGGTDNTGGTFDLFGNNQTVAGLVSQGTGGSLDVVTNSVGSTTGTLTVSGTGGTFAGQIADNSFGAVALTVTSGTQRLTGNNTYSGATTVTGGRLIVSGSLSGGFSGFTNVVVTGGTLAGSGMIAEGNGSNVTVASGGTLAPGLGANGLQVDVGSGGGSAGVNLQLGSTFQLTINNSNAGTQQAAALTDYSKLTLGSGVSATLAGAISLNPGTVNGGDLFTVLILNGQQVSGTFSNTTFVTGSTYSFLVNGQTWLINYGYDNSLGETAANVTDPNFESITGGDEVAVMMSAAVPEPGTWAMMLSGLGMLMVLQRRRRK